MSSVSWRLLIDGPRDGCWNMAVDEALIDARIRDPKTPGPPTLRLYAWSPATLSLGRSQRDPSDPARLAAEGIERVRRPTGGLAVLHDDERTYAVCGSLRRDGFPGGVVATYERIAAAVQDGLTRLGVDGEPAPADTPAPSPRGEIASCFHAPSAHELRSAGRKLVGSAQLRRKDAFLQHGSIPITFDPARVAATVGDAPSEGRAIGLADCTATPPDAAAIDAALIAGFEAVFGVRLTPGTLSDWELERATQLYSWKYSSLAWMDDGSYGERERRWGPL